MKKVKLDGLAFEVTRRCNQECSFCMRGKSQAIDIDYKVIDKLFYNDFYKITDINFLTFSGGEPLLNPDAIEYIINILIEQNIYVDDLSMITNGLVYDSRVLKALDKLNKTLGRISYEQLLYSPDQFHKKMPIDIKEKYSKSDHIFIDKYKETREEDIYNIGLARKNGIGTREEPNYRKPIFYIEKDNIIKYYPGKVREHNKFGIKPPTGQTVYINALGYVLANGDGEYNFMDKYNLGNIKDRDLINISTNVKTYKKVKRLAK